MVDGTSVPEAAVDHDRHLRLGEDEVRPPTEALHRRTVDEVSESALVELTAHGEFRTCVTRPVGLHPPPHAFARSPRTPAPGLW